MSFNSLGLCDPILQMLKTKGYTRPTPIQTQAVPAVLSGRDIMACAQTGTGKTAAFALPLLQFLSRGGRVKANHTYALILTPTRELAVQVAASISDYTGQLAVTSAVVYGGVKINPQMMRLRRGADVLVATPGRLLDLVERNAVKLTQVKALILDEADRMLDMGFSAEIRRILALLPPRRQNLLFSATFSHNVRTLADSFLNNPVMIEISPQIATAENVKQLVYEVDKAKKPLLLSHLIRHNNLTQVLIFTASRKGADSLVKKLGHDGITAMAMHSEKSQAERSKVLQDFKERRVSVLIATDIAARGLDIHELPHVINFDLPRIPEDYIHRIGRTGRAGLHGEAISLVSADEASSLLAIETLIGQALVREISTGFIPRHSVPLTGHLIRKGKRPLIPGKIMRGRKDITTGSPEKSESADMPEQRKHTEATPTGTWYQRRQRKP